MMEPITSHAKGKLRRQLARLPHFLFAAPANRRCFTKNHAGTQLFFQAQPLFSIISPKAARTTCRPRSGGGGVESLRRASFPAAASARLGRWREGVEAGEEFEEAAAAESVEDLEASLLQIEEAGLAHDREMLRDGREVASDLRLQIADAAFAVLERFGDGEARRMGERLDHGDAPSGLRGGGMRHRLGRGVGTRFCQASSARWRIKKRGGGPRRLPQGKADEVSIDLAAFFVDRLPSPLGKLHETA